MDKNEFIKNVLRRHNLSQDEISILTEDYNTALSYDTDFDSLFRNYIEEYSYNVAPKPAWFVQRAKKKVIRQSGTTEIRGLLVVLPSGNSYQFAYEYPYESEEQAIEGIRYRFKNKKYKLFRIAKIDEGEKGILRRKEEIF